MKENLGERKMKLQLRSVHKTQSLSSVWPLKAGHEFSSEPS